MTLATLSPQETARYDHLNSVIQSKMDHFLEVGLALMEIRDSKLYRHVAPTFEDYCREKWKWSANRARQLIRAREFWDAQKLIADTTGEVELPKNEWRLRRSMASEKQESKALRKHAEDYNTGTFNQNLSSMSARIEPESEVHFSKPPAFPTRPLSHYEVIRHLEQLERDLKSLLTRAEFLQSEKFRHAVHEVEIIRASIQMELPGMECATNEKKKAKGTLGEVQNFCVSLGLPESDGTSCFYKWEGNGWKNNGEPIKDWKSTLRHWHAAKYLPSQKQAINGQPVRETASQESLRKIAAAVRMGMKA